MSRKVLMTTKGLRRQPSDRNSFLYFLSEEEGLKKKAIFDEMHNLKGYGKVELVIFCETTFYKQHDMTI